MPQATNEVIVDAALEHVFAMARNVEVFPEFMPDVESITVVERTDDGARVVAEWVGVVKDFRLKVRWTEEDLWDAALHTCTFRQLKGDYQKYEGIWTFTDAGASRTRFASILDYDIEIPLIGPLLKRIVAKLVSDNVQRVLEAIKTRAEMAPQ